MKALHRPDGSGRTHFLTTGKPSLNLNPQILYVGELQKNPLWQETEHRHSFCEIIFIMEGCGSLAASGNEREVSRGDIIIYNPGCPHFEKSDSTFPMEIIFIALDKFSIGDMPPCTIVPDGDYAVIQSGRLYEMYRSSFKLLLEEHYAKQAFFQEICLSAVRTIIFHILRQYSSKNKLPPCSSVKKALSYIDENFCTDISLEEIADICYVTKYHMAHKFKQETGKTVGEYIRMLRIEKAKKLLTETELSVSSVAYECGFGEVNYFHRLFKKETGVTPGEYRIRYRLSKH